MNPADIVHFWREAGRAKWFVKDPVFDDQCRTTGAEALKAAAAGALAPWGETPEGALALVLLLDQFPRNLHRGAPEAFACDPKARAVAEAALRRGHARAIEPALRPFLFLPFEHSENLADQDRSAALFASFGDAEFLRYAEIHRDIIVRFGRFPHRNAILGRTSTAEETRFLEKGGFAG